MTKKFLILALTLGLFMRGFQYKERFNYAHDNDLASWIIKDIIIDKHPRLIGQLTSSEGIFVGPLFYYLQIPFYLLGNMDPIYVPILSIIIGLISICSIYFVFKDLYSEKVGNLGALIYAVSFGISVTEREVVPTTPVFLWTIWLLYALKKKNLLLIAILWGLIWHIHLALIFSIPLAIVVFAKYWKSFKPKDFLLPIAVLIFLSSPLILFEVKHGFSQTRSFLIATHKDAANDTKKVILYTARNINYIFWDKPNKTSIYVLPLILVSSFIFLWRRKVVSASDAAIIAFWCVSYLVIFSLSPLNLSEYYLNGMNILWILLGSLLLSRLPYKYLLIILSLFIIHNLFRTVNLTGDKGYLEKKALVNYIKEDALAHNYPCVAISYMTDPGYNLGYRYFFWLANLHVNQPHSNSPVYTIVFPHSRANRLDRTFGALGVVLPDYQRYTPDQVAHSCSGQNSNLTDPMFGFTK